MAFSFLPRLFRCGELVSQRGLVGVINLQVLGTPGAFSSGVNGPERELGSRLIAPEGELGPKKKDRLDIHFLGVMGPGGAPGEFEKNTSQDTVPRGNKNM